MTARLQHYSLAARLLLMLCLFLFNYVFFFPSIILIALLPFTGMEKIESIFAGTFESSPDKYIFLLVQAVVSLGGFAFTAILFSQLEAGSPWKHLRLNKKPALKLIVLAFFAILVAQFFIDFLVTVNQQIPVPDQIREIGKASEKVMNALLSGTSLTQFLVTVVVIALIPAIAEEFFFRGLLLGDLLKGRVHPAIAIAVTGLIFSIGHGNFENILAIWALGSFLGYLYYVSGSLWLPIITHFINNFLGVLLKYLYNLGKISEDLANAKTPLYATLIAIALFSAFIFLFNKWKIPATFAETPEPESLNQTPLS